MGQDQPVLVVCSHVMEMSCLPSHVVVTERRVMPTNSRMPHSSPSPRGSDSASLRAPSSVL